INKQHTKIQASIQYAKRIQDAMLPNINKFKQHFDDAFVLFMPKDVVSGDFYWMSLPEKSTGKVVIAAVDCTGHGVPGAFMSLVGDGHLNQIVNIHQVFEPKEILQQLDLAIRNTLQQDENNNRDGMDLSICTYNPTDQTLCYAGAKNPLILFQKGEMTMVKGDKMSIGGKVQKSQDKSFKQHTIDVSIPTTFYLFSDGYQDQFGGTEDKKFMFANLKKLLTEIHQLPSDQQKEQLLHSITNWMKLNGQQAYPQIDDILVIGAKIAPAS
ncbi:MAG: PP2C family protein-serine/threonine phosphatase, partial [Flammeovirgaceae bacterium]